MNTQIEAIEKELITLFRDNGVQDINQGDKPKSTPRFPAIDIMLTAVERNDFQVRQKNKIGWNLNYDISCMFAGTERNQTFINARNFVNKIYDLIQNEKNSRLNDTVFDLECLKIEYGRTTIRSDIMADGGVINLIIQIFEER